MFLRPVIAAAVLFGVACMPASAAEVFKYSYDPNLAYDTLKDTLLVFVGPETPTGVLFGKGKAFVELAASCYASSYQTDCEFVDDRLLGHGNIRFNEDGTVEVSCPRRDKKVMLALKWKFLRKGDDAKVEDDIRSGKINVSKRAFDLRNLRWLAKAKPLEGLAEEESEPLFVWIDGWLADSSHGGRRFETERREKGSDVWDERLWVGVPGKMEKLSIRNMVGSLRDGLLDPYPLPHKVETYRNRGSFDLKERTWTVPVEGGHPSTFQLEPLDLPEPGSSRSRELASEFLGEGEAKAFESLGDATPCFSPFR